MSLTTRGAPLASQPPETVNYRIDGPRHPLFLDPFAHRVRAELGGVTVLDSTRGLLLHESNLPPQLYVPWDDVGADHLERTDHATHCPFKGDARYWTVRAGGKVAENAVWAYPDPMDGASWLRGLVALYWDRMDRWLDEEEVVVGRIRDPYHRVDVRPASRRVRVLVDGTEVAASAQPLLLFETGLPVRPYLRTEEVTGGRLLASPTRTVCPYKGTARHWHLELPDGRHVEDACWEYAEPLDEARRIAGRVAFYPDRVTLEVDGVVGRQ